MRRLTKNLVGAVLTTAFIPAAFAANNVLSPGGGLNAWDLYVMGNGAAVAAILTAVSSIVHNSAFRTLLLFMATAGFLTIAVQAGFDAGKNLLKMFGYILSVWAVVTTAANMTANINVTDEVSGYDSVVQDVPALVGVPAAVISDIGHWLTQTMETNFSTPTEFQLTQGGFFNIFGKMMSDGMDVHITNQNLKLSLSSYVGDCVVPAMAQGRLTMDQLNNSTSLVSLLSTAALNSVLTKYYAYDMQGNPSLLTSTPTQNGAASTSCANPAAGGMGSVVTCNAAYQCLQADLNTFAGDWSNSTTAQWAASGIVPQFGNVMQTAIEWSQGGGASATPSNSVNPMNTILQKAMAVSMTGAFKEAATESGNNDLLLGAAVEQSETAQKTGWVVSAEVFNNMMGYVYTTLQAFIFGIVPIIIIALMIPGMGRQIFASYAKILVWLTLWQPMFAIINFLILQFSKQDFSQVWMSGPGPTMQNVYAISEQTNNMVVAAKFLGTMVPMISWGIVSGSMAFTEFISHGMGSQVANSAGQNAALGNLSGGSISLDNVNDNKFNTAQQSTVGNQEISAYASAGSGATIHQFGGSSQTANGGSVSAAHTQEAGMGTGGSTNQTAGVTHSGGISENGQTQTSADSKTSNGQNSGDSLRQHTGASEKWDSNQSSSADHSGSASETNQAQGTTSFEQGNSMNVGANAGLSGGGGGGGGKGKDGAGAGGMLGAAKTAFGGKAGMDKTTRDSEAVAGTHNKNAQDGTSSRDSAGFGQGAAIDQGQQHSSEMGSRSSSDHSSGSSASTSQGGNSATNGSLGTQASISDSFNNGSKDTITFNRPIDSRGFPELVGMLNTDGRTAFTQQQQSNFSAMTSGIDNATTSAQSAMSAGSSAMSAAAGQVGGGQQAFAGTPSNWQPNMASNIARDYVGNKDAYSGYSSAFESAFSGNKKMAQGIMGTSSDLGMLGQFGHTANAANISIDKGPNVTAGAAAIGTTGAIVYGALQGAKNATIAADTVVAATAVLGPEAFLPAEAITTVVAGAAGAIYGAMHAVE